MTSLQRQNYRDEQHINGCQDSHVGREWGNILRLGEQLHKSTHVIKQQRTICFILMSTSFLLLTLHCNYVRCIQWRKLGEHRASLYYLCNVLWTYNYFRMNLKNINLVVMTISNLYHLKSQKSRPSSIKSSPRNHSHPYFTVPDQEIGVLWLS